MRELEVLTRAAHGLPNIAIARELWVTEQTVKFHMSNVIRKLDASNRQGAVWHALELGLIDLPKVPLVVGCPACGTRYRGDAT